MEKYAELDGLKARLDSQRPLDAQKVHAVREKFRLEWTYHSNALEGNPLSLSETGFFIREGLTSKGKPLSAYLEAGNHLVALDFLESLVKENTPISEHLIRQYHSMLFDKIDHVEIGSGSGRQTVRIEGGVYKQQNNHVVRLDGKVLQFVDWLQVPGEMERLIAWYEEAKQKNHPLELAAMFHHKFVSIHPFLDGNGRVSRLLMNTILMQAGYTPAIIPVEERKRYLEVLQAADDGNYDPFFGFVEELTSKTLSLTIDVVEGREAFDFDDLSHMFRNMAMKARSIDQDLGPASRKPEERSFETAQRIMQIVEGLLAEHAKKISTDEVHSGFSKISSVQSNPEFERLRSVIQHVAWTWSAQLTLSGSKRFIPLLQMDFVPMWGRYQTALVASTRLGRFNSQLQEEIGQSSASSSLIGSIYFEDWDSKTISDFVLEVLKDAYKKWDAEMERRKAMIAEEEVQISKLRSART